MPTKVHECPNCQEACDCERGSEVLVKNPDMELTDLEPEDCDHDCDEDDATDE